MYALQIRNITILVVLIILLLVSLLAVCKAPTYHLWLLAVAVTEFPLIFIGISVAMLVTVLWMDKYQLVSIIAGIAALMLYLSPMVRSYIVASTIKTNFTAAFGPGSTAIKGDDSLQPFSFWAMFKKAPDTASYSVLKYGKDAEQTLDFYPAQFPGIKPCIIVVHGGSWSSGDSKQLPELNTYLANAGYNVASINYHLSPKYQSPVAINDVNAVFEYLGTNAVGLHIDTNNFVLLGRSAGAQIALLAAYQNPQKGLKGVIDFYGPADMVWGYSKPASKLVMDSRAVMERYLGGKYNAIPDKYFASSPIEFVNRQTVPTLIIHGDNDVLVSPIHSQKLDMKLQQKGIKHYYLNLPWATHGFDYNLNGPGGQLSTYVVERFINSVCK